MTHSAVQNQKKSAAMKESLDHFHSANVTGNRGGMDHEAHKVSDLKQTRAQKEDEIQHGGAVGGNGNYY